MDTNNIFCTCVLGDSQYVVAAITAAKSYRDVGGKLQFWCLWSDLVEDDVEILKQYFDRVIEVPILYREMPKFQSQRKDAMYGRWINKSFTRFNCFNPEFISQLDVKFVCEIDSDVLFVKNPDNIFDAIGPNSQGVMPIGVICDTPYTLQYKIRQPFVCNSANGPRKYHHGEIVPTKQVVECMKQWRCIPGYIIIFSPNDKHWNRFNHFFNNFVPCKSLLGYDEQLLGHMVADHKFVVNVSPGYAWHVGKTKWYSGEVWCQHYAAGHPWLMNSGDYPDVTQWWDAWYKLLSDTSDENKFIALLTKVRDDNKSIIEFNNATREQLLIEGKIDASGKMI